ncbi:substrate-binding domain-containing protein [Lignipirellula cremea]|uniref:Xylose operon regulatory protein n=1 Tax=Lignipirellula cremea TaxID=2528010 RepID=A0A518DLT0_9BACT|nr:substrate-binding domain-containing protein [Lignipirellula cremea]QDU92796.1 Xylose operon regulatory protein [Lignipirellula cremea]
MAPLRVGIMLELMWPYRRHVDVFAGTQHFARDAGDWLCEIDECIHGSGGSWPEQLTGYDGLIARASSPLAQMAWEAGVPLVNVWLNSPEVDRLPGVFPDFAAVGRQACGHLADRGFRQFACLSSPRERAHREMTQSFHAAIEELGAECTFASAPRLFYRSANSWVRFQQMLDDWIAGWKTPIGLLVAANDVTARYVVHACRRNGLRIPEDVGLLTSTNEPLIGEMPPPSLTSVEVNYEQIGYQAAQLLDRLMRGGEADPLHRFLSPTGIIARDSTDFFAVDDETVAIAMRHIERHTRQGLAVDDVAAAVGVSRRTLERRFQTATGRSVAAEIRRLRVLKAKRLLAETELLVKQIAHETGFRDSIRLHEVFVRETGQTPSDYRRTVRGEA